MERSKITKTIDNLGRVLIPKDVRKQIGIESDDELEMYVENERIILEKKTKRCIACSSEKMLIDIGRNRYLCGKCKSEIQQIENN